MIKLFVYTFVVLFVYGNIIGHAVLIPKQEKTQETPEVTPHVSYQHESLHFEQKPNTDPFDSDNHVQLVKEISSATHPNIIRRSEVNGKIVFDRNTNINGDNQIQPRFQPISHKQTQRVMDQSLFQHIPHQPQFKSQQTFGNRAPLDPPRRDLPIKDPFRYSTTKKAVDPKPETLEQPQSLETIESKSKDATSTDSTQKVILPKVANQQVKKPTKPTKPSKPTDTKVTKDQEKVTVPTPKNKKPNVKSNKPTGAKVTKQRRKATNKKVESTSMSKKVQRKVEYIKASFSKINFNKKTNLILFGSAIAFLTLSVYFMLICCLNCCAPKKHRNHHIRDNESNE